jgi:hypothetical protein
MSQTRVRSGRSGGSARCHGRRPDPALSELELKLLQARRHCAGGADHTLVAGVVHESHPCPDEAEVRGAVGAQEVWQRARPEPSALTAARICACSALSLLRLPA